MQRHLQGHDEQRAYSLPPHISQYYRELRSEAALCSRGPYCTGAVTSPGNWPVSVTWQEGQIPFWAMALTLLGSYLNF